MKFLLTDQAVSLSVAVLLCHSDSITFYNILYIQQCYKCQCMLTKFCLTFVFNGAHYWKSLSRHWQFQYIAQLDYLGPGLGICSYPMTGHGENKLKSGSLKLQVAEYTNELLQSTYIDVGPLGLSPCPSYHILAFYSYKHWF